MNLYLVQHAEALSKEEDPDRRLSDKGKAAADRMANFLEKSGVSVSRVVHSGKARARQTADILSAAVAKGKEPEVGARLEPNDSVEPVARWLNEWDDEDIMIVGHLPFMERLLSFLVAGDSNAGVASFKPGSIARLDKEEGGWTLSWMIRPELLKG